MMKRAGRNERIKTQRMSPASEEINGKFVKKEGSGADENI
jgi:hypothetical protein